MLMNAMLLHSKVSITVYKKKYYLTTIWNIYSYIVFYFWLEGTTEFLQTNPSFVGDQSLSDETSCNKDTGGLKAFHSWSRGVFVIVSAGGNIEYWQPLYRCVYNSIHRFCQVATNIIVPWVYKVQKTFLHSFGNLWWL
jgi:hypothetical protein